MLKRFKDHAWEVLLALAGALAVLLPASPFNMPYTNRDSGVFLYIGSRLLEGAIPYRDVWDHKPPLIYFLNALGLALSGGSLWGVWIVELGFLFAAGFLSLWLIRKAFGSLPAVFTLFLWLVGLSFVLTGGNQPSEYALALQFAVLAIAFQGESQSYKGLRGVVLGLLFALLFMLRQNSLAIPLAVLLYLAFARFRLGEYIRFARELLTISISAIMVGLTVIAYFSWHGALDDFWQAAFVYNFAYISIPLKQRLINLLAGMQVFGTSGLLQIAFLGYGIALIDLAFPGDQRPNSLPLLKIGLIAFPLEFILVYVSGRTYLHYYAIGLLPVLAIFSGYSFYQLFRVLDRPGIPRFTPAVFSIVMLSLLAWTVLPAEVEILRTYREAGRGELIRYISANTSIEDRILIWGAETSVHFFTGRPSPTRYVYQYPLHQPGYTNESMILEFLDDLENNPPRLIMDSIYDRDLFMDFPIHSSSIDDRIQALMSNYRYKEMLGVWKIYEYSPILPP